LISEGDTILKRLFPILLITLLAVALQAETKLPLWKSLLVPGWSQVSAGRNYGYAMLSSEVTILGSMFYLHTESSVLKQDSYEYAIKFAHLNPGSYDNEFYNNLARYGSSGYEDADGYNAFVVKTAQQLYPYDPEQQQVYIDEHSYGDDHYWDWDSPADRSQFNKLRNRSQDFKDYALVAGGVLILNHLISAVDVMRLNAEHRRSHFSLGMKEKTPLLVLSVELN